MENMENLEIYNHVRAVPPEAIKEIKAGRLKGMSDINPMWRIKRLTEMFGPCGIGWWYVIKDERIVDDAATKQRAAFVDIDLYYSWNGKTSMPVPGTGGASFLSQERNGLYLSDECFKMALTDAISVAAKAIGVGADVYYAKDRDKYTGGTEPEPEPIKCEVCGKDIPVYQGADGKAIRPQVWAKRSKEVYGKVMCDECRQWYEQTEALKRSADSQTRIDNAY